MAPFRLLQTSLHADIAIIDRNVAPLNTETLRAVNGTVAEEVSGDIKGGEAPLLTPGMPIDSQSHRVTACSINGDDN
jgi:hypothetical protein